MTSSIRKAFLAPWTPEIQFLRYRNKINIQRPAKPHYERAKVIKICTPTFNEPPKITRPVAELCLKPVEMIKTKEQEENPYADIIAKELFKRTEQAQFVGFVHRNPTSAEEHFKVQVALKKFDATVKVYGKAIVERALRTTYYEPALCLFQSQTGVIFGGDAQPKTVSNILRTIRRSPTLLLLAAIIDKRLLDRNELETYSQLSDLTTARSHLVATLNSASGGQLVEVLTSHQNTLTRQLDQYVQQQGSSLGVEEIPKSNG